jgi:hypothetical protein
MPSLPANAQAGLDSAAGTQSEAAAYLSGAGSPLRQGYAAQPPPGTN